MNSLRHKLLLTFTLIFIEFGGLFAQNDELSFGGIIRFDKLYHDFGDILTSEGSKKCTFTYTNISDKPIVINDIVTSCGCTSPKWSRKPLNPGASEEIAVTFLNDQGPYPFDKTITLFITGLSRPVTLHIRGIAHSKRKSLNELFPYNIENTVGLRSKEISAGYIDQGETKKGSFEIANLTKKKANISFVNVTDGLSLTISPNPLPAGERATVTYVIDTKKNRTQTWGNTTYNFSIKANDLPAHKMEITSFIKENFSEYTPEMKNNAPLPRLSKSSYSMESVKKGEKVHFEIDIRNIGKEDLIIHKLDIDNKGVTADFQRVMKSNVDHKIKVTVDTSSMEGEVTIILSFITNSPTRPIANFYITGTVV